MLEAVLNHIHNFFVVPGGVHAGEHVIASGCIDADYLKGGQYFRIVGSVLNDGVYQYPAGNLRDEVFTGEVWAMAVPPAVVALSTEIDTWCAEHPATNLVSEAFGGYSVTRASATGTGAPMGWESVFRGRLSPWRKLS